MPHIFISYSSRDSAYALKLANHLRKEGIAVWLDNLRLEPGDRLWPEIKNGIDGSYAVLVLLAPESMASEWVRKEIAYAARQGKQLFPLLLRPTDDLPAELTGIVQEHVADGHMPIGRLITRLRQLAPNTRQVIEDGARLLVDAPIPGVQNTIEALIALLRARSAAESKSILLRHRELLNDGPYAVLQNAATSPTMQDRIYPDVDRERAADLIGFHCLLVNRCREIGIEAAFDEFGPTGVWGDH